MDYIVSLLKIWKKALLKFDSVLGKCGNLNF